MKRYCSILYSMLLWWVMFWVIDRLTKRGQLVWRPCAVLPPTMTLKQWAMRAWERPWCKLPTDIGHTKVEYVVSFTLQDRPGLGIRHKVQVYSPYRYVPAWLDKYDEILDSVKK